MKRRIILYLSVLFALFTVGAVISMLYITLTTRQLQRIIMLHSVEILRQDLIIKIQNVEQDLLTVHTELGRHLDTIVSNVSDLDNAINICAGCHHSPEISGKIQNVRTLVVDFESTLSHYITASANEDRIRALKMESYGLGSQLLDFVSEMAFIANQKLQQRTQEAIADVQRAQQILVVTLVLALGFGIWIAVALTRRIIGPIRELIAASRRIASDGPGYTTLLTDGTEFGELAQSMNEMSLSLQEINRKVAAQMRQLQETQEQLVQAAKLAAIGELASNVAHEINNPLTSIFGYTELIAEEEDLEQIREDLKVIGRESLRAREIVRQLLEFARKRPLELAPTDINDLLADVAALLRVQLKEARVSLSEEYGTVPAIEADANQLKQVFLNLLNNAVDAVRGSEGHIVIRTAALNGSIGISISDNGQGIPSEILPRIFEPFFTTKREKGTGLGLSVSYKIVQSHGGRIEVESAAGRGATFTVILPVPARDDLPRPEQAEQVPSIL